MWKRDNVVNVVNVVNMWLKRAVTRGLMVVVGVVWWWVFGELEK